MRHGVLAFSLCPLALNFIIIESPITLSTPAIIVRQGFTFLLIMASLPKCSLAYCYGIYSILWGLSRIMYVVGAIDDCHGHIYDSQVLHCTGSTTPPTVQVTVEEMC